MTDDKKAEVIKLPRPSYPNLGSITDGGVPSLQAATAGAIDPFANKLMSVPEAEARLAQIKARNTSGAEIAVVKNPAAKIKSSMVFVRGGTYRHKKREGKFTLIQCGVKKTDDDVPMHKAIDENDNEVLVREDLLKQI